VALDSKIRCEHFRHILTDLQLVKILEIGQALKEQDTLDQIVGMLHLADGFFIDIVGEAQQTPILQHARMQEILVDRRQFIGENDIQMTDYFGIALHFSSPCKRCESAPRPHPLGMRESLGHLNIRTGLE